MHPVEGEILCRCTNEKVPYFNAFVYLENKTPIGKVDEILGPITEQVRRICQLALCAMGAEARARLVQQLCASLSISTTGFLLPCYAARCTCRCSRSSALTA